MLRKGDFEGMENQTGVSTEVFLKQKEAELNGLIIQTFYNAGRIFFEVKERLKEDQSIRFEDWLAKIGMRLAAASRCIKYYSVCEMYPGGKLQTLPQGLVLEFSSPKTPQTLKEQVLNGNIKTMQEFKKMKKNIESLRNENEEIAKSEQNLSEENKWLKKEVKRLEEVSAYKDALIKKNPTATAAEIKALIMDLESYTLSLAPKIKAKIMQIDAANRAAQIKEIEEALISLTTSVCCEVSNV